MATATAKVNENEALLDFRKLRPRSGGRAAHVPEGDYLLELVTAKNVAIQGKRERQISAQLRIVGTPDHAEARKGLGDTVYTNLQIGADSKGLWFTRNFVEDLVGKEGLAGKAFKLTLDEHFGKRIGATLADGTPYIPKNSESNEEVTRSEIKYTFPASRFVGFNPAAGTSTGADEPEGGDEEDEEEAPKPAPKKAKAAAEKAAEEVASTDDEDEIEIEELEDI